MWHLKEDLSCLSALPGGTQCVLWADHCIFVDIFQVSLAPAGGVPPSNQHLLLNDGPAPSQCALGTKVLVSILISFFLIILEYN